MFRNTVLTLVLVATVSPVMAQNSGPAPISAEEFSLQQVADGYELRSNLPIVFDKTMADQVTLRDGKVHVSAPEVILKPEVQKSAELDNLTKLLLLLTTLALTLWCCSIVSWHSFNYKNALYQLVHSTKFKVPPQVLIIIVTLLLLSNLSGAIVFSMIFLGIGGFLAINKVYPAENKSNDEEVSEPHAGNDLSNDGD